MLAKTTVGNLHNGLDTIQLFAATDNMLHDLASYFGKLAVARYMEDDKY